MRTLQILFVPIALAALLVAAPAASDTRSEWTAEVEKIDEVLRDHKWKQGLRRAKKLKEEVLSESWYGPGLRETLRDLAVFQAVAEANLDLDEEAVEHWHIAWNLDFRVSKRDLTPYGDAAKLLLEHPLRARGKVPAGFEVRDKTLYSDVKRPRPDRQPVKTILNNTAAVKERPGDFHVELLVDKTGGVHHPVVISDDRHPIVIYAVLEWVFGLPNFKPAEIDGEATDFIEVLAVDFHFERW